MSRSAVRTFDVKLGKNIQNTCIPKVSSYHGIIEFNQCRHIFFIHLPFTGQCVRQTWNGGFFDDDHIEEWDEDLKSMADEPIEIGDHWN